MKRHAEPNTHGRHGATLRGIERWPQRYYTSTPEALAMARRLSHEDEPSLEDVLRAKADMFRARADALDAAPDVITALEQPSYVELQAAESTRQWTLADDAAMLLHCTPLDQLTRERRYDLLCGAAYLLRRPESAWRASAQAHTVTVLTQLYLDNLQHVLSAEACARLAVTTASVAATAYQGVLEGTVPVTPGAYLRIEAAKLDARAT